MSVSFSHTHIHTGTYACIQVHTCGRKFTHAQPCIYICIHAHMCVYARTYVFRYTRDSPLPSQGIFTSHLQHPPLESHLLSAISPAFKDPEKVEPLLTMAVAFVSSHGLCSRWSALLYLLTSPILPGVPVLIPSRHGHSIWKDLGLVHHRMLCG